MPFDPFFASSNKKHFVEDPEATKLLVRMRKLPAPERIKICREWKERKMTKAEKIVLRIFGYEARIRRQQRIDVTSQKNIDKAIHELQQGKRDKVMILQGFQTTTGTCCNDHQYKGFGSR